MPWQPNLETAQQIAARSNRLVLIHFWAPWCQPCMRLEKEVFSRSETARAWKPTSFWSSSTPTRLPEPRGCTACRVCPPTSSSRPTAGWSPNFKVLRRANQYVAQLNQAAAGHRELVRKTARAIGCAAGVGGRDRRRRSAARDAMTPRPRRPCRWCRSAPDATRCQQPPPQFRGGPIRQLSRCSARRPVADPRQACRSAADKPPTIGMPSTSTSHRPPGQPCRRSQPGASDRSRQPHVHSARAQAHGRRRRITRSRFTTRRPRIATRCSFRSCRPAVRPSR